MADAKNGEFDPRLFTETISSHGHGGHIGLEYHDHGTGWVELKLPWREELVGDVETGILASGPIISMMDNATSLSVWTKLGTFRPQVTLDLRVDYMRAAKPRATVYGRGECYQVKRSIAFVRGIAHDGDPDDPVAHVVGTFINLDVSAS
ncbi:MAG: PaaI family thioesterase [Pseudomonadota bacterium]